MDQKGGQTIMVNLLFVICAMDILYLIYKIPNLFINKPIVKFISLTKEVEKELAKIESIDVSISHLEKYAVATVNILF